MTLFYLFKRLAVVRLPLADRLSFGSVVFVVEFGVYNRESQVEEKECTNENEWHEEQTRPLVRCLLNLDHYLRPAFQGHRLEHHEQGVEEVVEVSHAIVGVQVHLTASILFAFSPFIAHSLVGTLEAATKVVLLEEGSSLDIKAPLLQIPRK